MTANLTETVIQLEHSSWQALQKSGKDFLPYLAPDAVMLFPLGMRISHSSVPNLNQVMTSDAFEPWQTYKMTEVEVTPIGTEGAVITYKAEARKSERDPVFKALCSSIWRKDASQPSGQWLLVMHQQTPYEEEL